MHKKGQTGHPEEECSFYHELFNIKKQTQAPPCA